MQTLRTIRIIYGMQGLFAFARQKLNISSYAYTRLNLIRLNLKTAFTLWQSSHSYQNALHKKCFKPYSLHFNHVSTVESQKLPVPIARPYICTRVIV